MRDADGGRLQCTCAPDMPSEARTPIRLALTLTKSITVALCPRCAEVARLAYWSAMRETVRLLLAWALEDPAERAHVEKTALRLHEHVRYSASAPLDTSLPAEA